jgi:type I restriction enzyme M protein
MTDQSDRIVKKLWSYCQVLRDDGLSYQDYLEQLAFLLFLKMADERAALTGEPQPMPKGIAGTTSRTRRWRARSSKSTIARR